VDTLIYCIIGAVILIGVVVLGNAIRIVPEYQRLVVFRLGRCVGEKGPGLVLLIPIVDRAVRVDLREQVREIPQQTSITKDNAPISIDFLWFYKVLDPTASVLAVGNFELAAQGMATTTLRSSSAASCWTMCSPSVRPSITSCALASMKSPGAGVSR